MRPSVPLGVLAGLPTGTCESGTGGPPAAGAGGEEDPLVAEGGVELVEVAAGVLAAGDQGDVGGAAVAAGDAGADAGPGAAAVEAAPHAGLGGVAGQGRVHRGLAVGLGHRVDDHLERA